MSRQDMMFSKGITITIANNATVVGPRCKEDPELSEYIGIYASGNSNLKIGLKKGIQYIVW